MSSPRNRVQLAVAALVVVVTLAACGSSAGGVSGGPSPSAPSGVTATEAAPTAVPATDAIPSLNTAAAEGGDPWCQSILAMTSFMTEEGSLKALAGTPVPDGAERSKQLAALVADMKSKGPAGHDADWVILDQVYALWVQQLAAPTADRLSQIQSLTNSGAMTRALENLNDDIVKACPNVKFL